MDKASLCYSGTCVTNNEIVACSSEEEPTEKLQDLGVFSTLGGPRIDNGKGCHSERPRAPNCSCIERIATEASGLGADHRETMTCRKTQHNPVYALVNRDFLSAFFETGSINTVIPFHKGKKLCHDRRSFWA